MIYTVSDLHGCLEDWQTLLDTIHFSDQDTMFVLGDCVDLGPDPIGLLHDMMERPNVFPTLGNHELSFVRSVQTLPHGLSDRRCPRAACQVGIGRRTAHPHAVPRIG